MKIQFEKEKEIFKTIILGAKLLLKGLFYFSCIVFFSMFPLVSAFIYDDARFLYFYIVPFIIASYVVGKDKLIYDY